MLLPFEDDAHIVQAGNEARPVRLAGTRRTVRKTNDVGAALPQPTIEGESIGVKRQRHESGVTVAVVAHEHRQMTAGSQCECGIFDQPPIADQKLTERHRVRQVARIVGVMLLSPVGRMLRTLWNLFVSGDVMLADRLMCTWTEIVMLQQRGVDCVCRLTSHRQADFRRGNRLGKGDHIVQWHKPTKPRSIDRETYDALPESLTIREICVRIEQAGFRTKILVIATTLLNADEFTKDDLAQLYRARWNAELDLRSLKRTLQMDVLRCKTPELVRKEIWTHVLAYNLIRTIMAQAATKHGIEPRTISFKGAVQTLEAFQPVIAMQAEHDPEFCKQVYQQILEAIATHRVADRPDRFEPRLRKRRPKHYGFLRKPRGETKRELLNGFNKI